MSVAIPLESESMRCVDFAVANQLNPGGTGLAPDVVVVVEVDEPWPKPVAKHDALVELVRAAQNRNEQIRLLAAVPKSDDPRRVIAFRPTPTGMDRSERVLCVDPVAALHEVLDDHEAQRHETVAGITSMLVCTQGSHDVCCGEDGAVFAKWAEQHTDVEVFRVSHTGGHRFAPTAMTLPDGRMWAYLDEQSANQVLSARDDAASVAGQCRGWWGAPTGPAQMAERAVFAELGFDADTMARTVEVDAENPGAVIVTAGADVYDVRVEVGREIATIACGAPGGQPVKSGREWAVIAGPTLR